MYTLENLIVPLRGVLMGACRYRLYIAFYLWPRMSQIRQLGIQLAQSSSKSTHGGSCTVVGCVSDMFIIFSTLVCVMHYSTAHIGRTVMALLLLRSCCRPWMETRDEYLQLAGHGWAFSVTTGR